jgi:hypothetical protein
MRPLAPLLLLVLVCVVAAAPACGGAYLTQDDLAEVRAAHAATRAELDALREQSQADAVRIEQQREALTRLAVLQERLAGELAALFAALRDVRDRLQRGLR